jgi:hypothetical protein
MSAANGIADVTRFFNNTKHAAFENAGAGVVKTCNWPAVAVSWIRTAALLVILLLLCYLTSCIFKCRCWGGWDLQLARIGGQLDEDSCSMICGGGGDFCGAGSINSLYTLPPPETPADVPAYEYLGGFWHHTSDCCQRNNYCVWCPAALFTSVAFWHAMCPFLTCLIMLKHFAK